MKLSVFSERTLRQDECWGCFLGHGGPVYYGFRHSVLIGIVSDDDLDLQVV